MIKYIFLLLFASACYGQEVRLIQSPVGLTVTTQALTGLGSLSVKVPGTFSGGIVNPTPKSVRYLSYVEIFADNPAMGDYVDGIKIVDDDGVIPQPLRVKFPEYPTVINFSSDTDVGGSSFAGFYLSQNGETRIGTFPQLGSGNREEPQPIPSGLYLKATIHNAGLLSKSYRVNIMWGRIFQ